MTSTALEERLSPIYFKSPSLFPPTYVNAAVTYDNKDLQILSEMKVKNNRFFGVTFKQHKMSYPNAP